MPVCVCACVYVCVCGVHVCVCVCVCVNNCTRVKRVFIIQAVTVPTWQTWLPSWLLLMSNYKKTVRIPDYFQMFNLMNNNKCCKCECETSFEKCQRLECDNYKMWSHGLASSFWWFSEHTFQTSLNRYHYHILIGWKTLVYHSWAWYKCNMHFHQSITEKYL